MNRRSSGVQGLVFGGIMAALVLIFALVPFLNVLIPVPLVLAYVRHGGRTALLTSLVAVLLTAMFRGPVNAFLVAVPFGILPGLIFGFGFRRRMRPLSIALLSLAIGFVGFFADYTVTRVAVFQGRDPIVMAAESQQGKDLLNGMLSAVDKYIATQPKDTADRMQSMVNEFRKDPVAYTWATLPMGIFLMSALNTFINYSLCSFALRRMGFEVPPRTAFSEFRLPNWFVWLFALASFGSPYLGQSLLQAPWWVKLINNVIPPLSMIILLYGVSIAYGYLRRKANMAKGQAILFSLVPLFLGNLGTTLFIMVAMWDTVFDFRGLGHGIWKRPEPNPWEGE